MKLSPLIQSMRLSFLILTPICVFLGASLTIAYNKDINVLFLILALLGAISAHISVNTLNEYFDFKSGLDFTTQKTPFSGGSGALPQSPEMANSVYITGIISFVITLLIGVFFVWQYELAILPLGIVGLLIVATYTHWINKHPLLCLIAPGMGFGVLIVAGTQLVVAGQYSELTLPIILVAFFLINNLLLLNQYPDIEADRRIGRYHFPIAYGIKASNTIYGLFITASIITILVYVFFYSLPIMSLIALLPAPLAFYALHGAKKHKRALGKHPKYLAANVAVTLLMPALLGLSLIW